jgi:monoamine oxidase
MSINPFALLARRFDPAAPTSAARREMLKASALVGAGLMLSSLIAPSALARGLAAAQTRAADTKPVNGRRVIVVGAGLSGLACAYELSQAGYDVQVFEARKRLGGRALSFSEFVPNKVVEAGGEFIGTNHPLWNAYAQRFNLELLDADADEQLNSPIVFNGRRLDDSEAERVYVELAGAFKGITNDASSIDPDEPWKSPNALELDSKTMADWVASLSGLSAFSRKFLEVTLTANLGVALDRASYLAMLACVKGGGLDKYWTETETHRCATGAQSLAQKFADALGSERILLGTPIARIILARGKAAIETVAGDRYEGDEIVVSVPPSAWRTIEFFPDLPRQLTPQMGSNIKFLAGVGRRFWRDAGSSAAGTSDGEVMLTWESTANQPGDAGACLTAFAGGPASEALRLRSDANRQRDALMGLQGLFPGLSRESVNGRFLDWPSDRWAGASYSFPAPGQVTTISPVLQQPRAGTSTKPILHFAGEHCCTRFAGYMEGALQSGVSVARRIATRDGLAVAGPNPAKADPVSLPEPVER